MIYKTGFLLAVICCVGCSSSLDRDFAGEKIKSSVYFNEAPELWIDVGRIGPSCFALPSKYNAELAVAEAAGYVTEKPDGKDFWQVALTDKGRALPEAKKLDADTPETKGGCNYRVFSMSLGNREFVEVTGITSSENIAQVDFLFKWKPSELGSTLTEQGSVYSKLNEDQRSSLTTKIRGRSSILWSAAPLRLPFTDIDLNFGVPSKARFQKYDDGWRMMTP